MRYGCHCWLGPSTRLRASSSAAIASSVIGLSAKASDVSDIAAAIAGSVLIGLDQPIRFSRWRCRA